MTSGLDWKQVLRKLREYSHILTTKAGLNGYLSAAPQDEKPEEAASAAMRFAADSENNINCRGIIIIVKTAVIILSFTSLDSVEN